MDPVNSPAKKKQKKGNSEEISSLGNSKVAPHSACTEMQEEAPSWFQVYEARLITNFDQLSEHCTSTHGLLLHNIDKKQNDGGAVRCVKKLFSEASIDIDIIASTTSIHCTPTYRSIRKDATLRPIHIDFTYYRCKDRVKKELIKYVSSPNQRNRKIFVNDDLSRRVVEQRKAQMATFKAQKEKGLKPFFIFPSTLKAKDPTGWIISPPSVVAQPPPGASPDQSPASPSGPPPTAMDGRPVQQ